MADEDRRADGHPPLPRGWGRHPAERMLITPLMAGVGGLLAFFTVVAIVVWLPIHTFDPGASKDWAPLSGQALKGRNLFASNGCYVCHSGYSRPQDVRAGPLLPLPEDLRAGRLLRQRPVAEPARHRAHRPRPLPGVRLASGRLAAGALLRPALHGPEVADAGHEGALLRPAGRRPRRLRRAAERQVRPASLRGAALREARRAREPGLPARLQGLLGRAQVDRRVGNEETLTPPRATSSRRRRTSPRSTAATGSPATRCR